MMKSTYYNLFSGGLLVLFTPHFPTAFSSQVSFQSPFHFPFTPINSEFPEPFPNFSSSAPHLLAATAGLAREWPNTFYPKGHTVVLVEVPAFTLFYHGRLNGETPQSPEWLSFDVEMAYGIFGSTRTSHLLTYQATKPISFLYFDGESATLFGSGRLDTQMLAVWGNTSGPGEHPGFDLLVPEYARAMGLCDWIRESGMGGRGWGVEGVVRMNAGFEVVWCDFLSESLTLIANQDVTGPEEEYDTDYEESDKQEHHLKLRGVPDNWPLPPTPTKTDRSAEPTNNMPPPHWRRETSEPFLATQAWGWFDAATRHYTGESRFRPIGCAPVSYYGDIFDEGHLRKGDKDRLNLTEDGRWKGGEEGLKKLGRRRRGHGLRNATIGDAEMFKKTVEAMVKRTHEGKCSGMDWVGVTRTIIKETVAHVKMMTKILSDYPGSRNKTDIDKWRRDARGLNHLFLVRYLRYPASNGQVLNLYKGDGVYQEALTRCKYHYTRLFVDQQHLAPEEAMMKTAVEDTLGGICRTFLDLMYTLEISTTDKDWELAAERETWVQEAADQLDLLRAWLGWEDEFVECKEVCEWDERCYIPMWPMLNTGRFRGPPHGGPGGRPRKGGRPPHGGPPGHGRGGHGHDELGREGQPDVDEYPGLWEPKCVRWDFLRG